MRTVPSCLCTNQVPSIDDRPHNAFGKMLAPPQLAPRAMNAAHHRPSDPDKQWVEYSSPQRGCFVEATQDGNQGENNCTSLPVQTAHYALSHDLALTRAAVKIVFPTFYFVVFLLMLFVHIPPLSLYKQSNALYSSLASSGESTVTSESPVLFFNIQAIGDVWSWLELTLVPTLFVTEGDNGTALPAEFRGRIATHNRILGAVRFTVVNAATVSCDNQAFIHDIYPTCYDRDVVSERDDLVSSEASATEAVSYFEGLKDGGEWINRSTVSLHIDIVTYNGELEAFAMTTLWIDFQEGGVVEPSASTISAKSTAYGSAKPYVMDGLVVFCFLLDLGRQLSDLWRKRVSLKEHLMDFWSCVDHASSTLVVAFYIIWATVVKAIQHPNFQAGIDKLGVEVKLNEDTVSVLNGIISTLERVGHLTVALRLIATVTILFLGTRILGRFRFDPRLNVLSQTIAHSLYKFGTFLIVCSVVLVTFALSGHIVFGDRAAEFSTVRAALQSCVNILFGNFDYAAIDGLYVPVCIVYYWGYIIIVSMILLNMMLAIVLDTYEEVSQEAFNKKAETAPPLPRIFYIVFYNAVLWLHDLHRGSCRYSWCGTKRTSRSSLDLAREEVVFWGRARMDVLEAALAVALKQGRGSLILESSSIQTLFAPGVLRIGEAEDTVADLRCCAARYVSEEEEATREPETHMSRTVAVPVMDLEWQWQASMVAEVEELSHRIAVLNNKLDLVMLRSR